MDSSSSRRVGLIVGAFLVVVIAAFFWKRSADPAPPGPRPRASTTTEASPAPARVTSPSSVEARRARDAMRADILEAMRKRAAAVSPPAQAPVVPRPSAAPAKAEEPRGSYEPSYIQQHFREDMFPLLRSCYEGALRRQPKLAGKLVLAFDIVGDPDVGGIVEEGAFADGSTIKDPEMETCVRESLMTLTFDKPPRGGGRVSVTYPVDFSPGDDDEVDGGAATDGGSGATDGGRR